MKSIIVLCGLICFPICIISKRNFQESQFYKNSYGYDSSGILLTDTQVVHLMAPLTGGDYDTDKDNLLDKQELSYEEEVNISNLLEEYIKYNKLPEEEANKLRADPYIKMWAYKSNPALPDTDFDGRNDDFDIHKPLENRQAGKMSTLNYEEVNFDYNQDYRYFAMKPDQYYYDLSEMSMILANMVNKKSGINRRWLKDTNYINKIADDSGGITTNTYRERYNAYSIEDYMNYIGLQIKGTEINIFKAMINFAKNDEFLTIIITVPFIYK